MIRNIIILVVCVLFLSGYAFAEKPPWAGKGKPTAEQKQAHKKDKKMTLSLQCFYANYCLHQFIVSIY